MGQQYGVDNWIECGTWIPWQRHFIYADTAEHKAERIFAERGLRVRSRKGHYRKEGSPYCFVVCSVSPKDRDAFIECMADMHRAILLAGHTDYDDACSVIRELRSNQDREREQRRRA